MNILFEQEMLRMIDEFLAAPTRENYYLFEHALTEYRFLRYRAVELPVEESLSLRPNWQLRDLTKDDWSRLSDAADDLIAPGRAKFFSLAFERLSYTVAGPPCPMRKCAYSHGPLTDQDRKWGYGSLEDYIEFLHAGRREHRARFGV